MIAPIFTSDNITSEGMRVLSQRLLLASNRVQCLHLDAEEGNLSTDWAADELNRILADIQKTESSDP